MVSTDRLIRIIVRAEDQMTQQMDKMASSVEATGRKMRNVGAGMTAALTAPIVGAGAAAFKAFASYQDVMVEIQARTQATAEEMDKMGKLALKMGADTKFSATESAQALLELTSSGSSAAESMEMLPDVLDLAAAGALGLKDAADGVTDIMAMFSLEAQDAERVVNALTKASGSSSATVSDLNDAFKNVGPVAKQFGFSVDETAATLALFAENGIKGAESGTQLRSMLLNMTRDTEKVTNAWNELGVSMFDAEGNMRNVDTVFKDINAAMADMSMEEQNRIAKALAGSYGLIGFNVLRTSNGFSDMQAKMQSASTASTVADARMSTLSGAVVSLMGSIETLGIALGTLGEGPLTAFIQKLIAGVNAITAFVQQNPKLAQVIMIFLGIVAAIGPVLLVVGQLMTMWGTLTAIVSAFVPVMTTVIAILGSISAPVLLLIAAIAALIAIFVKFGHRLEGWTMIGKAVQAVFNRIADGARQLFERLQNAFQGDTLLERVSNLALEIGKIMLEALAKTVVAVTALGVEIMQGLAEGIRSEIKSVVDAAARAAKDAAEAVRRAFKIRSPSRVMMQIGEQVTAGFQEGVTKNGGMNVGAQAPSARSFAGASGGGNIYINNLNVPPGTTRQQVDEIMRELGRRVKQKGGRGTP